MHEICSALLYSRDCHALYKSCSKHMKNVSFIFYIVFGTQYMYLLQHMVHHNLIRVLLEGEHIYDMHRGSFQSCYLTKFSTEKL